MEKYINSEDKVIINVYEVLNSNGIKKLLESYNDFKDNNDLFTFTTLKDKPKNIDDIKYRILISIDYKDIEIKLLSLKVQMVYAINQVISHYISKSYNLDFEFVLPIYHYKVSSKKPRYLFRNFYHVKLNDFPNQYIILNSKYNLSAKNLYDYIWNLNKLYMNHPNLDENEFWWNKINKNENDNIKLCYPFVLRYLEIPEKKEDDYYSELIHCPLCPWYSFCPGCIIDPTGDLTKITSRNCIVVDWCYDFIEEELLSLNFKLSKDIDNQEIIENLPFLYENKEESIKDCFDLFFKEEELKDDLLYCNNCKYKEIFSKKYSIVRLPYVLIISFKRFKYNENIKYKLDHMISYPIYDLNIENKKYDLYEIINHEGNINSGHYTSIIKNKENKWILLDDNNIKEIEEKDVINSNAYILFYISKESPFNFDYIKMMKSIMNNVGINPNKNFFKYEPVEIELNGKNNIGYIMEENIENFDFEENEDSDEDENEGEKNIINQDKNFVKVKFDKGEDLFDKNKVKKFLYLNELNEIRNEKEKNNK